MSNTPDITALSVVSIKIGGSLVPTEFMRALIEVVVDTNLYLPAMFTMTLHDNDAKWADNASLISIGNPVEIELTAAEQGGRSGTKGTVIKGEITAIEPTFGELNMRLCVRGYCKSHRLHRGKQTQTFLNQTDSAVVSALASAKGLRSQVQATSVTHPYIIQYHQTDWEFISERATRLGYRFYMDDDVLYFKKAENGQTVAELKCGEELLRFRPRLTAAQQSLQVQVKSWNPNTKQAVVGTSTQKGLIPSTGFGDAAVTGASTFGAGSSGTVNIPTEIAGYATAMADAIANRNSGRALQAEGEALGDPRIVAGKQIKITGAGERFGGTYTVTSATHIYESGGYITRFSVTGGEPDSLYSLLPNNDSAAQGREFGVVIGLVTNNNDPQKKGRVRVKFPWLSDQVESHWARLASPMAGADRGILFMPEVNDEVLVAFEQGDLTRPYVLGCLWNGRDAPPIDDPTSAGKTVKRIIKTRAGHQILLVDKDGEEAIKIIDKTGKNSISIDSVRNDIAIVAEGNISLEAKGKITLSAQMDVTVQSKTGKVVGNGATGAELVSKGPTSVSGQVVQVEGKAAVKVTGKPILLN